MNSPSAASSWSKIDDYIRSTGRRATASLLLPERPHRMNTRWLAQLGYCRPPRAIPDMNGSGQNPYLLRRFLDSENISEIEFEANVCGVFEIARLARTSIGRYSEGDACRAFLF